MIEKGGRYTSGKFFGKSWFLPFHELIPSPLATGRSNWEKFPGKRSFY
jgi:hypothetical protein